MAVKNAQHWFNETRSFPDAETAQAASMPTSVQRFWAGSVEYVADPDGDFETAGGRMWRSLDAMGTATAADSKATAALVAADSAKIAAGLTPMDFGAVGDGVADDTAAITEALQSGARINGDGRTYRVLDTVNIHPALQLENITLDFSDAVLPNGQSGLRAVATNEPNLVMTADATVRSNTILCDTTGLVTGDVMLVQSQRAWSDDGADVVRTGETVVVASDSAGQAIIYPALSDSYRLADSATVRRIGGVKSIRMRRVNLIGPGESVLNYGMYFARAVDIKLEQCRIEKFGAAAVAFENCYDFEVSNSALIDAYGSGLGYGVVCLSACRNYRLLGNLFQRGRTGWTQGGTSGVGRDIVVANNNFIGQYTGALGTKNAADGITVTGNTCVGDGGGEGLQDGIRIRGRNAVVQGNVVYGFNRYQINMVLYGQPEAPTLKTAVVSNNTVKGSPDIAILIQNLADGAAGNIVISGNNIDFRPGLTSASKGAIHVRSEHAAMKNVNIIGNTIANCPFNLVDVRPAGSGTIDNLNITQNVLERTPEGISAGRQTIITLDVTNETTTPNVTV